MPCYYVSKDSWKIRGTAIKHVQTCLSRAGIPLRTIQKMSCHSNLGQLHDYLEVDEGDNHRAINLIKY